MPGSWFKVIVTTVTAAAVSVLVMVSVAKAQNGEPQLKAGAARVDITPPVNELPEPYTSIHDNIYARALILDNGTSRAVIAVVEVPAIQADIYKDLAQRISQEAKVPPELVLLGTTHTHNAIRVATVAGVSALPSSEAFNRRVIDATLEAVRKAQQNMQPARAGFTTGKVALVANRNEWLDSQHRYIDGVDRTGTQPIDQSLGVYKIESLAGKPIAFLLNYAIEPVVYMAANHEISGDVPGAASRYVEEQLGDDAVAIFTVGSPGSPLYRVWSDSEPRRGLKTAERIMDAMGVIIGEEALARASGIGSLSPSLEISAAIDTLQCPGKITTPRNLRDQCAYSADSKLPACVFTSRDADPVRLSMGLMRLGDVAFVTVDSNIVPALQQKMQQVSPLKNTLIVGLNFGPFRFVVDDAAYPLNTYEATDTRAKPGCAEDGFLNGVKAMIEQTTH
jgi:hypothetical protein